MGKAYDLGFGLMVQGFRALGLGLACRACQAAVKAGAHVYKNTFKLTNVGFAFCNRETEKPSDLFKSQASEASSNKR